MFLNPRADNLTKFLENNWKNLKELHVDNFLSLAIAKFCQNLKSLSTAFRNDEIENLKVVLNSCQQLENIRTWCG